MAGRAAELLVRRLRGGSTEGPERVVAATLVLRESTGPGPRARRRTTG